MSDEATCEYDPRILKGAPIGQFHCPYCSEMQLAGMEHTRPLTAEQEARMDAWLLVDWIEYTWYQPEPEPSDDHGDEW